MLLLWLRSWGLRPEVSKRGVLNWSPCVPEGKREKSPSLILGDRKVCWGCEANDIEPGTCCEKLAEGSNAPASKDCEACCCGCDCDERKLSAKDESKDVSPVAANCCCCWSRVRSRPADGSFGAKELGDGEWPWFI